MGLGDSGQFAGGILKILKRHDPTEGAHGVGAFRVSGPVFPVQRLRRRTGIADTLETHWAVQQRRSAPALTFPPCRCPGGTFRSRCRVPEGRRLPVTPSPNCTVIPLASWEVTNIRSSWCGRKIPGLLPDHARKLYLKAVGNAMRRARLMNECHRRFLQSECLEC